MQRSHLAGVAARGTGRLCACLSGAAGRASLQQLRVHAGQMMLCQGVQGMLEAFVF